MTRRPGSAYIVSRHAPPGRTSIDTVSSGTSDWVPPNQSANRSGSVHSFQTRSRGASKTRVTEIPGSASGLGCSATPGIIPGAEALVESVEAVLPEAAVAIEPLCSLLQRRSLQA